MSEPHDQNVHDDRHVSPNAKLGLSLFAVYFLLYLGFMWIAAFRYAWFAKLVGGVNLAIVYGMGLIIAALVLAIVYMFLCKPEEK